MQTHHMDHDGLLLRWQEQGEGPPTVLLHGIPTSPALWHEVMAHLSDRRALAFEMVGYGESIPQAVGRDLPLSAQADVVAAWMDRLATGPAVVAGHDLGGGVAQILAVRRPDLVAGLLLTNAVCYDSWPIPFVRALQPVHHRLHLLPDPVVRASLGQLLLRGHDTPARGRRALDRHVRPYRAHGAGAAVGRQIAALDARDTLEIADHLPRLRVPARVVWGTADAFQKPSYGERLARDLGTRPVALAGAKHFTPENHPRELALQLGLVGEAAAETSTAPGPADAGARGSASGRYSSMSIANSGQLSTASRAWWCCSGASSSVASSTACPSSSQSNSSGASA